MMGSTTTKNSVTSLILFGIWRYLNYSLQMRLSATSFTTQSGKLMWLKLLMTNSNTNYKEEDKLLTNRWKCCRIWVSKANYARFFGNIWSSWRKKWGNERLCAFFRTSRASKSELTKSTFQTSIHLPLHSSSLRIRRSCWRTSWVTFVYRTSSLAYY